MYLADWSAASLGPAETSLRALRWLREWRTPPSAEHLPRNMCVPLLVPLLFLLIGDKNPKAHYHVVLSCGLEYSLTRTRGDFVTRAPVAPCVPYSTLWLELLPGNTYVPVLILISAIIGLEQHLSHCAEVVNSLETIRKTTPLSYCAFSSTYELPSQSVLEIKKALCAKNKMWRNCWLK